MLNLPLGFGFRLMGNRLPSDGTPTLELDFTKKTESMTLDLDFTTETYRVRPADVGGLNGEYIVWS
jgi:hypothetical protein